MADQSHGSEESELTPTYRFWADKAFYLLLLLAVVTTLGLLGAILSLYPQLPERLPIIFNAEGQADLVANKIYLFRLPLGVALVTLFNGAVIALVVNRSAFAARMLMLASCWVGLLLMAGLWFIIR